MRVKIRTRPAGTTESGLELDRSYAVHQGPDPNGTILVFDDHTASFRALTPAQYQEVPDPLEPHDLLRIDHGPGGYQAICTCVWRHWQPVADPDQAAHTHQAHLRHMDTGRHHLTTVIHPQLQAWINDLRARQRRQEPER
jgi:hypothetical protein